MTRTIYIVQLAQHITGYDDYDEIAARYWSSVRDQLDRQSIGSSSIKRIFVETFLSDGDDALAGLERAFPQAHSLVRHLISRGASFEDFEDPALLTELVDWARCASQELLSAKVRNVVSSGHAETSEQRQEHLKRRLNEAIGDGEKALVLVASENLPIPDGVERFIISPPELDQMARWFRAKMEEAQREMMQQAQREASESSTAGTTGSQSASSGLWTPP